MKKMNLPVISIQNAQNEVFENLSVQNGKKRRF